MFNNKKIVLSLLASAILFNALSFAQTPANDSTTVVPAPMSSGVSRMNSKVSWSQEYTEPTNSEIQKIIGTDGGGFYALRQRKGGFLGTGTVRPVIEHYNAQSKLIKSQEIDLDYKGNERYLKDVVMVGGKIFVLSYYYNQKYTTTYLFAQEVQKTTLKMSATLNKIAEREGSNKTKNDFFNFTLARDSSKIAIFDFQPSGNDKEEFSVSIFNSDFAEQWSRISKLPYTSKRFKIEETQLDSKGNFYILGKIFAGKGVDKSSNKGVRQTFQYDLFAFRNDSLKDFDEYKIIVTDKLISDLTFRTAEDDDLVLAGFYSEKSSVGVKGSCFFKINARTKDMTSISMRPLDFNFITANFSAKDKERAKLAADNNNKLGEAELLNYNLDKLILRSDGGAILIAEQYYVEERIRNNSPFYGGYPGFGYGGLSRYGYGYSPFGYNSYGSNARPDYYFHYNDIIVLNIRPDGDIEWTARIPKRQMSVNDYGLNSSYAQCTIADKLVFIYNEDARNLKQNKKKQIEEEPDKTSVVAAAEVDKNGNVTIAPLFGNNGENIVTRPKICRQIGKKEMAIYGEHGRTYKFGSIAFDRTVAPN